MISSMGNNKIKEILKLQKKARERRERGLFVVEGSKMVEEARHLLVCQYISESYLEEEKQAKDAAIKLPYEVVSDKIFRELSDTMTPQGILAVVKMPQYSLQEIIGRPSPFLLLLEDVRDPGNLGTMLRCAEGAGVTGVIISKDSVDLFNPKVVRSTMGSIFRMPFCYVEDFHAALHELKENNISLYATDLQGINDYDREQYKTSCGIIIGNEANGITNQTRQFADALVKIPMEGKVESLNAAVASAVMMYEVYRQKRSRNKSL